MTRHMRRSGSEKGRGRTRADPDLRQTFVAAVRDPIDGTLRDRFYDVRDAVEFAQAAKKQCHSSKVIVVDTRTDKLVLEME